uniref:Retinoid X receptor n=1 Tax=Timema bartmani TaxID=61472 RepID=A0A7R9HWR6_9NEOP|nr:unnamed protein product [Timema bartmani]
MVVSSLCAVPICVPSHPPCGGCPCSIVPGLSLENNLSVSSLGPQSPLDMKPDTASLLSPGSFSPTGGGGPNSPGMGHGNLLGNSTGSNSKGSTSSPYPPNHPLSNSKHLCSICGDRASGKHYGVYRSFICFHSTHFLAVTLTPNYAANLQSKTERKHSLSLTCFTSGVGSVLVGSPGTLDSDTVGYVSIQFPAKCADGGLLGTGTLLISLFEKGREIRRTHDPAISSVVPLNLGEEMVGVNCEGCKGFFKRTVRKDLTYACREDRNCIIDKRQRNRCQYCRYQKCLAMGMKREAVQSNETVLTVCHQEERQRTKERDQNEVESTSSLHADMPVERILEAEKKVECKSEQQNVEFDIGLLRTSEVSTHIGNLQLAQPNAVTNICQATNKQLFQLVEWAKNIPHFTSLPIEDQVLLLRAGWNELLIAAFSHRSIEVKDGIVLATGLTVHRNSAHQAGVGTIFDRVLSELVSKMREMKMDKTELGCLRSIILFNPDVRGLKSSQEVELLREKVYAALEEYTRITHHDEPGRFAKLLLRLPSLRSIGLKCLEHLFFFRLIGDVPIDTPLALFARLLYSDSIRLSMREAWLASLSHTAIA